MATGHERKREGGRGLGCGSSETQGEKLEEVLLFFPLQELLYNEAKENASIRRFFTFIVRNIKYLHCHEMETFLS